MTTSDRASGTARLFFVLLVSFSLAACSSSTNAPKDGGAGKGGAGSGGAGGHAGSGQAGSGQAGTGQAGTGAGGSDGGAQNDASSQDADAATAPDGSDAPVGVGDAPSDATDVGGDATAEAAPGDASDAVSSDAGGDASADSALPAAQTKWFAEGVGDVEAITRGPDDTLWFITTNGKIGHVKAETDIPTYPIDSAVTAGTTGRNRITKGPDGNLWFTIQQSARIGYITPAGVITAIIGSVGFMPDDLTTGPDGNLWVSGEGVSRITPAGVVTTFPCGATNTILSGPDGNLWFIDAHMGVARITTAGVVTQFGALENNEMSFVHGLALASGQLWMIGVRYPMGMASPEQIYNLPYTRRMSTAGTLLGTPATLYKYRDGNTSTVGTSTAVGPDGSLWYYEKQAQIGRVTPAGAVQRFDLPAPGTTYRFSKMTFDAAGALWLPMRGGLLRFTLVN